MGPGVPYEPLLLVGGLLLAFLLGRHTASSSRDKLIQQQQLAIARSNHAKSSLHRKLEDLTQRVQTATETASALRRSIVEIPEIAQRLSAIRELREIPECVLDLIEEIYKPTYALFFRPVRRAFVVVAARGESEFQVGHRLESEEGLVQWSSLKQLPIRPEDLEFESGLARGRYLSEGVPSEGFSLCIPIVDQNRTIGNLLIGPCQRSVPHAVEIGRTVALMTSVVITSALVLKQQQALAKTDGLTGLFNRTHILDHVGEVIVSDEGPVRELSVLLFDIDHFKNFNDTNGHLSGDELLKTLSKLLTSHLREGELIGRYGGEEFLMVLPGVGKSDALKAAERIRHMIAAHAFPHREKQPLGRISISGGVASWPADGMDLRSFLNCADEALYEAKRLGRDRVVVYSSPELAREGEMDLVIGHDAGPGARERDEGEEEKSGDGLAASADWAKDAAAEPLKPEGIEDEPHRPEET